MNEPGTPLRLWYHRAHGVQDRDRARWPTRVGAGTRGELLPGERLPTVRALAADAALAPNTVARAYRELEAAGYLEGRGRAGTFVVEEPPPATGDAEAALADAADRYLVRAKQLGFDATAATHALDAATRRKR